MSMTRPVIPIFFFIFVLLNGCGTTAPTTPASPADASPPPPVTKPAMSLRVASLDLSSFSGRVENAQVEDLAALIGKLKIDVIAIQGLVRYPGIATRTDLLDALGARTGMRTAFGETITISGRQSGNALLSAYPIESSDNRSYEGISGRGFEGALRAIVDAGARSVVFVSTRLPDPLSAEDSRIFTTTLSSIEDEFPNKPLIVAGNLPPAGADGVWETPGAGSPWYTPRGIALRRGEDARCAFGKLVISEVDVFPAAAPLSTPRGRN